MTNNTIRGTSIPDSTILTNLREAIEAGEILVKTSRTSGNYKITELIDKKTGLTIIPEHIVPRPKPIIRPFCKECEGVIKEDEPYITKQLKGTETILYYHNTCHMKKGTISSDPNWNGNINDNE